MPKVLHVYLNKGASSVHSTMPVLPEIATIALGVVMFGGGGGGGNNAAVSTTSSTSTPQPPPASAVAWVFEDRQHITSDIGIANCRDLQGFPFNPLEIPENVPVDCVATQDSLKCSAAHGPQNREPCWFQCDIEWERTTADAIRKRLGVPVA